MSAFGVIKEFEEAVAKYTGAKHCVFVNSCTNALFLALRYWKEQCGCEIISVPKRTYVSVPMQVKHAGHMLKFDNRKWKGDYSLYPTTIVDSARKFTRGMCKGQQSYFVCTSHHWSKPLGIQHGGCILHDSMYADEWFRRARFDGRSEGVAPKDDYFPMLGWHMLGTPENAAAGLVRLGLIGDGCIMPNDKYPDLSKAECFK
jgi:dTDP-4-amino-4,6-dideoxygalactose transaminase